MLRLKSEIVLLLIFGFYGIKWRVYCVYLDCLGKLDVEVILCWYEFLVMLLGYWKFFFVIDRIFLNRLRGSMWILFLMLKKFNVKFEEYFGVNSFGDDIVSNLFIFGFGVSGRFLSWKVLVFYF